MLERFEEYLKLIEMPEALRNRAEELCVEFQTILPGEINQIFVSDRYDEGGVRRYYSLWLIMGNVISECKNFAVSDNIDFLNFKRGIRLLTVDKNNLGDVHGQTSVKSELNVRINFGDAGSQVADFVAAHTNCKYLADLVVNVFSPNLERL
jgi:hypothetical protein